MASNQPRKLSRDNCRFSVAARPTFTTAEVNGAKLRRFSGVAYSGEVIPRHTEWGDIVFDLATISSPSKNLAALIDHDPAQRCGYITEFSNNVNDGLIISGNLLTNAAGAAVSQDSDEGFPWQMSVFIDPAVVEFVPEGSAATVNNRSFTGPLTIFKNSRIAEVSFTAVGWDSNTSAVAMSRTGDSPQPILRGNDMEAETLQDRVAALEVEKQTLQASKEALAQELAQAKEQLLKFGRDTRTREVRQLFSEIKREYKDDDASVLAFSAMPDESFSVMATVLREQAKATQVSAEKVPALFSHTAKDGAASAAPVANPLMPNAEQRAKLFKRG